MAELGAFAGLLEVPAVVGPFDNYARGDTPTVYAEAFAGLLPYTLPLIRIPDSYALAGTQECPECPPPPGPPTEGIIWPLTYVQGS